MTTSVKEIPEQRHRILQRYSGAVVRRVIDRSHSEIAEHAHDWPMVSVFVLGAYTNTTELDEKCISEPSILFYRGGATHRNIAGPRGFEQVEIEFDPAWLGVEHVPDTPVQRWIGGSAVSLWRALQTATVCHSESGLRATLRQVLRSSGCSSAAHAPQWLRAAVSTLRENPTLRVHDVARNAGLHPSWTGHSYRRYTGESLRDTTSRLRVEQAAYWLRETDKPCASIALDSGFCDQSHMNRVFRKILGRPPMEVRSDRAQFRQAPALASIHLGLRSFQAPKRSSSLDDEVDLDAGAQRQRGHCCLMQPTPRSPSRNSAEACPLISGQRDGPGRQPE